jgi:ribosomal protein S11
MEQNAETHAAAMIAGYDAIDHATAQSIESVDIACDMIDEGNEAAIATYSIAMPTIATYRRRLAALVAALSRLESKIRHQPKES